MSEQPAKVVSLRGSPLASPGEPDARIVEKLKWLIELAEAGQMSGFAYAFEWPDTSTGHGHVGVSGSALIGALEFEKMRILEKMT